MKSPLVMAGGGPQGMPRKQRGKLKLCGFFVVVVVAVAIFNYKFG